MSKVFCILVWWPLFNTCMQAWPSVLNQLMPPPWWLSLTDCLDAVFTCGRWHPMCLSAYLPELSLPVSLPVILLMFWHPACLPTCLPSYKSTWCFHVYFLSAFLIVFLLGYQPAFFPLCLFMIPSTRPLFTTPYHDPVTLRLPPLAPSAHISVQVVLWMVGGRWRWL